MARYKMGDRVVNKETGAVATVEALGSNMMIIKYYNNKRDFINKVNIRPFKTQKDIIDKWQDIALKLAYIGIAMLFLGVMMSVCGIR